MLFPDLDGFGRGMVVAGVGGVGVLYSVWVAVRLARANLEGIRGRAWLRNHSYPLAVYLVLAGSGLATALFDKRTNLLDASAVLALLAFSLYKSWGSVIWMAQHQQAKHPQD
jgi:hypothetical protein